MRIVAGTVPLLGRGILGLHLALALALGLSIGNFPIAAAARGAIGIVALLPLALTLRGLAARRPATLRWLAVALVLYAGFGSVEVIATGSLPAIALLLASLLELAATLILLRHPPPR